VARRKAEREPRLGDRPEVPPVGKAAIRFPLAEDDDPASIERPRPVTAEPSDRLSSVSDATGQHPVLDVGQPTGEVEMPHWTSNATGEVPRVVIGDAPVAGDSQSWTSYASGAPQWRDQSSGWDEPSFADLAADLADDGSVNVGALTPQPYEDEDTLTHDEYLGFDDLEVPAADAPLADLSRVTARGTAADPIRIGSADLGVAPNDRDAESRSNAPMYRPPAGQGTTVVGLRASGALPGWRGRPGHPGRRAVRRRHRRRVGGVFHHQPAHHRPAHHGHPLRVGR